MNEINRVKKRKWRRLMLALLPVVISAGILFYAFRGIAAGKWTAAWHSLSLPVLFGFIAFSLAGTFLRHWRFSILLSHRIRFFDLFLITLVQNFSVDLLPARSAALGFFTFFTRRQGIDWEVGVAGFVSSVVYDVLAVALLLSPALFYLQGVMENPLPILAALAMLAFLALFFLRAAPLALQAISSIRLFQRTTPKRILKKILTYFKFHQGPAEQARLLGISFLIKLAKYLSIYVFFLGLLGIKPSFSSFFLFNFAVAAAEISAYLPIQGLAGFGTWEAAFALAVKWIGVPVADPFLTAFIIHLVTQLWEYSIGIAAFFLLSYRGRKEVS